MAIFCEQDYEYLALRGTETWQWSFLFVWRTRKFVSGNSSLEISLEKLMMKVFVTSNQCLYHFVDVQSRAQLPYLTMLTLAQSL